MDDIVLRNKIRNYKFFVMVGLLVTSTMTHRTPTGTGVAAKLFSKNYKKNFTLSMGQNLAAKDRN